MKESSQAHEGGEGRCLQPRARHAPAEGIVADVEVAHVQHRSRIAPRRRQAATQAVRRHVQPLQPDAQEATSIAALLPCKPGPNSKGS